MKTVTRRVADASIIGLLMVVLTLGLLVGASGCKRQAAGPQAVQTPPTETTEAGEPEAEEREHEAVPAEYASLQNPVPHGQQAIAAGKALYDKRCVGCHGATGKGDGPKSATLKHKPAKFTDAHMAEEMTDAAFFWRISEGVPDHDMPTWKGKLTATQRWQLVHFVRSFAPTAEHAEHEGEAATEGEHAGHEHAPGEQGH